MQGKFITFEGLDGAGKSTHVRSVVEQVRAFGHAVVATREPGGTPLAEKIRELLLAVPMDASTETLLMFASRQQHLTDVIRPALAHGDWVVCDRFTDASYAFQGGGRGLDPERIRILEEWVHPDLQPDLTILFDIPFDVARGRICVERSLDRFETEKADFHERVRLAYLARAQASRGRIVVVDAAMDPVSVGQLVGRIVADRFK